MHHKVNRGKSGHYIAVCQHQDSNGWFTYDDEHVYHKRFLNKKNGNVLTQFLKSAAILFYVNYTAVPVHSNNLRTHNGNIETQSLVDIGDEVSLSSSTVSSPSSELENHRSGYSDTPIKEGGAEKAPSTCQTFLQRREGHFCTICHETHFLPETELATLDTARYHFSAKGGLDNGR